MLSPFWNGFIIGAFLFVLIGEVLGILTIALCQAGRSKFKDKGGEIYLNYKIER